MIPLQKKRKKNHYLATKFSNLSAAMSMETQKATFTLKGLGADGGAAATGDCGKGKTK